MENTGDEFHFKTGESFYVEDAEFQMPDAPPHSGTWLCLEYELNGTNDITSVHITESDGSEHDIETSSAINEAMTEFYVGGYYNQYNVADANTYVMIDELKVSTSYIGPPTGFVSGSQSGKVLGTIATSISKVLGATITTLKSFLGMEF
jgi:hypothetical protein